jgi:hypothetical protein
VGLYGCQASRISVVVDELCFSIFGRNHPLAITSMR